MQAGPPFPGPGQFVHENETYRGADSQAPSAIEKFILAHTWNAHVAMGWIILQTPRFEECGLRSIHVRTLALSLWKSMWRCWLLKIEVVLMEHGPRAEVHTKLCYLSMTSSIGTTVSSSTCSCSPRSCCRQRIPFSLFGWVQNSSKSHFGKYVEAKTENTQLKEEVSLRCISCPIVVVRYLERSSIYAKLEVISPELLGTSNSVPP